MPTLGNIINNSTQIKDLGLRGDRNKLINNPKLTKINYIADSLVEKLGSKNHLPFYQKVAWRLDGGTIDRLLATALECGNNPRALFICLVKQEDKFQSLTG